MQLDLRSLRYFKMVVDQGSFTKAAAQLHIAQPALSMAIKKLENSLELQLLHRGEQGISMTDEGKQLYRHALKLLQAEKDAIQEMAELRGLEKGEVRVGIPGMLGSYYFPAILMAFRHLHPSLNLVVIEGGTVQLQTMLESGELDLAVIVREFLPESLEAKTFLKAEMLVTLSQDHPFALKDRISFDEFFSQELVMFKEGFFHRKIIDRLAGQHQLQANIGFETNLIPLIKAIVKQGYGISTLLGMVIQDEPELVARPFEHPVWLDLCISWRKEGYLSRANRAFVEFLLAHSRLHRQRDRSMMQPEKFSGVGKNAEGE